MSEQIKKIIDKSHIGIITTNGMECVVDGCYIVSPARLAKFAEMIVEECIDYMNYRTDDWNAKLRWIFNDDSGYMEVNVDSLLKEHFEIK